MAVHRAKNTVPASTQQKTSSCSRLWPGTSPQTCLGNNKISKYKTAVWRLSSTPTHSPAWTSQVARESVMVKSLDVNLLKVAQSTQMHLKRPLDSILPHVRPELRDFQPPTSKKISCWECQGKERKTPQVYRKEEPTQGIAIRIIHGTWHKEWAIRNGTCLRCWQLSKSSWRTQKISCSTLSSSTTSTREKCSLTHRW